MDTQCILASKTVVWTPNASRDFSSKSAVSNFQIAAATPDWTPILWHTDNIPKISCAYRVIQNRLLTFDRLTSMGIQVENRSRLCKAEPELVVHLFFSCSYSAYIWKRCRLKLLMHPKRRCLTHQEINDLLCSFGRQSTGCRIAKLAFTTPFGQCGENKTNNCTMGLKHQKYLCSKR